MDVRDITISLERQSEKMTAAFAEQKKILETFHQHGGSPDAALFTSKTSGTIRQSQSAYEAKYGEYSKQRPLRTDVSISSGADRCRCRKSQNTASPKVLQDLIGRLFVGYSYSPVLRPWCPTCAQSRYFEASTTVTFLFPEWFWTKKFIEVFTYTNSSGPELLLRIPRIVTEDAAILRFAKTDDVVAIRQLLKSGLASPYDANANGFTALHVRNSTYGIEKLVLIRPSWLSSGTTSVRASF